MRSSFKIWIIALGGIWFPTLGLLSSTVLAQTGPALMAPPRSAASAQTPVATQPSHGEASAAESSSSDRFAEALVQPLTQFLTETIPHVDISGEAVVLGDGHAKNGAGDLDVRAYHGQMRATFGVDPAFAFGSQVDAVELDTNIPGLPDALIDHSIAFGARIFKQDNWTANLTAGVGFNGSSPYSDGDAWYGIADLLLNYQVDDQSRWTFGVDYNGNRSIFPDIPLPFVYYTEQVSDTFSYDLGLPRTGIWWRPADKLTVSVDYFVPVTANAKVAYELAEHWSIFGQFRNGFHAYRPYDSDGDNRRFFFQQRRLEAGVAWSPCASCDFTFAGGYAFDQELSHGFDARDTDTVIEPSSEPYIRLALNLHF
ncbi:MAG: hypothetical protein IT440_00960 [Phycisphaeraceae bacterium]|nr:hypothetical protein [Phycisphaeraceae bacterium]